MLASTQGQNVSPPSVKNGTYHANKLTVIDFCSMHDKYGRLAISV